MTYSCDYCHKGPCVLTADKAVSPTLCVDENTSWDEADWEGDE
jgi:hypothetical protein